MRKFIISDLHGNGEVYDSIMAYLDNLSNEEEIELYINGDLIDDGFDAYRMILDVKERIEGKGSVKIHFLGGNHEWMMYQALKDRKPGKIIDQNSDWMHCGGWTVEGELDQLENYDEMCDALRDFTGSLNIVHVFDEKILNKPILLVHGQAPKDVSLVQPLRIKDDTPQVFDAVWKREYEYGIFGISIIGTNRIGNDQYFTIVGNTPIDDPKGFDYRVKEDDSYFNIDGGCHAYAKGYFDYDHVPLVEVKDNELSILVFNHNNEIISGYTFDGTTVPMSEEELVQSRSFLNPELNGNGERNKQLLMELKRDGAL